MKSLIIGGTRGIGKATADALTLRGWDVTAYGSAQWDVHDRFDLYIPEQCDALIYCAGNIRAQWQPAFDFPQMFYWLCLEEIVNYGGVIVAVSSVAVDRPAKVNAHYAAAKAALESYARTVADSDMARDRHWRVEVIRFDLVDTDMLLQLPADTLAGRTAISAETAAARILALLGVE